MPARIGSPAKPSNQPSLPPPALTPEVEAALASVPRRSSSSRRQPAAGEVWLQSDATADGWIRCRAIEVGPGSILLLASQGPTIAQGTWARVASRSVAPEGATGAGETEQIRVFPLALYKVGTSNSGPVLIECETPLDPSLMARLSA